MAFSLALTRPVVTRARRIPFVKWGHLLRFDPIEIRRWIDGFRHHPGRPA